MILLADGEGPDQTAWMCRLIRAFVVHICLESCLSMAGPESKLTKLTCQFDLLIIVFISIHVWQKQVLSVQGSNLLFHMECIYYARHSDSYA